MGYNKRKIKEEFIKEELFKYLSTLYRELEILKYTRKIDWYSSTIIINFNENFRENLN